VKIEMTSFIDTNALTRIPLNICLGNPENIPLRREKLCWDGFDGSISKRTRILKNVKSTGHV
jgi:hypothetical protein